MFRFVGLMWSLFSSHRFINPHGLFLYWPISSWTPIFQWWSIPIQQMRLGCSKSLGCWKDFNDTWMDGQKPSNIYMAQLAFEDGHKQSTWFKYKQCCRFIDRYNWKDLSDRFRRKITITLTFYSICALTQFLELEITIFMIPTFVQDEIILDMIRWPKMYLRFEMSMTMHLTHYVHVSSRVRGGGHTRGVQAG